MPTASRTAAEVLRSPDRSPADLAAIALSYGINPLVLPPALFGIVAAWLGADGGQVTRIVLVVLTGFCLVPFGFLLWYIRDRDVGIELRTRRHRYVPFAVTIAGYLAAVSAISIMRLPERFYLIVLGAGYAFNGALLLLITSQWKISMHTSAVAGFFGIAGYTAYGTPYAARLASAVPAFGTFAAVGLVVTGAMIWARIHRKAHTPAQAFVGALFGLAAPVVELLLLERLGLFDT